MKKRANSWLIPSPRFDSSLFSEMRLTIDLDTEQAIVAPGVATPVHLLNFKRSATAALEVQFTRAGLPEELPADAAGAFEMKLPGKYDAGPLVSAVSWVKTGSGSTTLYQFTFSFITGALDALFQVDGDPANDLPSLELMAELQWRSERFVHKSQTLTVAIANDINRDKD